MYLSPPVVYYESWTEIHFNPMYTIDWVARDLPSDEMGFINAKLDKALMNFEDTVSSTWRFSRNAQSRVKGQVGDQPISPDVDVSMLWETGFALKNEQTMHYCTYDANSCYESKTVPVIFDISEKTGYLTGGQTLTLNGHGFDYGEDGEADCKVDTEPCEIISRSRD